MCRQCAVSEDGTLARFLKDFEEEFRGKREKYALERQEELLREVEEEKRQMEARRESRLRRDKEKKTKRKQVKRVEKEKKKDVKDNHVKDKDKIVIQQRNVKKEKVKLETQYDEQVNGFAKKEEKNMNGEVNGPKSNVNHTNSNGNQEINSVILNLQLEAAQQVIYSSDIGM